MNQTSRRSTQLPSVEGWELNVLRGFDLERYVPRVVILENLFNDLKYEEYMQTHGYSLWQTLPPNQIYVRNGCNSA